MPAKRTIPSDWTDPRWCILACPAIPRATFAQAPLEAVWERIADQADRVGWGLARAVVPMVNESEAIKLVHCAFATQGMSLLWPTTSTWTGIFGHSLDFAAAKVPIVRVSIGPDDGEHANAEVMVQRAAWSVERNVQSARNDLGRWVHSSAGKRYPFEPPATEAWPPAQFGPAAAIALAWQLGLRPNEFSFFADHAWVVQRVFVAPPADPWRVQVGAHVISVGGNQVYAESEGTETLAAAVEKLVVDEASRRAFARGEPAAGFGPRLDGYCAFPDVTTLIPSMDVLAAIKGARRQRGLGATPDATAAANVRS